MTGRDAVHLRRTVWAFLMAGPLGPLPWTVALMVVPMTFASGRAPWGLGVAVVCALVGSLRFLSGVRVRDGVLEFGMRISAPSKVGLGEIDTLTIGVEKGVGFNGYDALVLTVVTGGKRHVVRESLFCGRNRLEVWASQIASTSGFGGTVVRDAPAT